MAVSKKIYNGATDLRNRRVTVYISPRLVVEFEMDRRGIARVAVGDELADATRAVVRDRAMPYAIRISPRGPERNDGDPRYVESFRISQGYTVIAGMRRVAAKLVNVAPHAAAVEFTGTNPHAAGYGILRKTLAHLNGTGDGLRNAKSPWREEQHPRGKGGRFIPRAEAAPGPVEDLPEGEMPIRQYVAMKMATDPEYRRQAEDRRAWREEQLRREDPDLFR